ncbi:phosphatase 2C-like domain-containing protein [Aspergillus granulosus]|uniref:Protein phosphatase n=1 Tax=Aspergillus granulosus TaxID=176169 RepID=A0ABR4H9D0_9EURO
MVPRIPGPPSAVSSWAASSLSSSSSPLLRRWPSSASSSASLHPQWSWDPKKTDVRRYHRTVWPSYGITTPVPDRCPQCPILRSPFYFQTGYALCAKRTSRPFPPPFLSPPSSSFSDPLTTHYHSQDKRLSVQGELVRGLNNGDDAVLVTENFLGVNDGVGAWATRPRGHAALWSRLILHFWALEIERISNPDATVDPIAYLQKAYEETTRATTSPSEWFGTTTSVTALLHKTQDTTTGKEKPLLYVTNIGDCKVLVIRPSEEKVIFRTEEQWHWFDCPMQLGTNSVDTPRNNAVLSRVDLEEGDIVLALSDGVLDNLWEHEVLSITLEGLKKWEHGRYDDKELDWAPPAVLSEEKMVFVARELLKAALSVAQDPFAESPYMEKAIEEGLAMQGGKMDDISVVVGACKKRQHGAESSQTRLISDDQPAS